MFRQQKMLRSLSVSYQFGGISADPEAKRIELLYNFSYFYLFVCLFVYLFVYWSNIIYSIFQANQMQFKVKNKQSIWNKNQ